MGEGSLSLMRLIEEGGWGAVRFAVRVLVVIAKQMEKCFDCSVAQLSRNGLS